VAVYVAGGTTGAYVVCDARVKSRNYRLLAVFTNMCTLLPRGTGGTIKLAHLTTWTQCSAEDSYRLLDGRPHKDIAVALKLDRLWFWFRSHEPILQPAEDQRSTPSVDLVLVSKAAGSCADKQQRSSYTVGLKFSNLLTSPQGLHIGISLYFTFALQRSSLYSSI